MTRELRQLLLAWAEARLAMLQAGVADGVGYTYNDPPHSFAGKREQAAREAFLNYEEPK